MHVANPPAESLGWKKSLLWWLALTVACFHAAYTSIHHPAAGLLILGYAFGLVKLTDQPNIRRAFYFGLATGFLCYAPQPVQGYALPPHSWDGRRHDRKRIGCCG
jgi:hypothetical protein